MRPQLWKKLQIGARYKSWKSGEMHYSRFTDNDESEVTFVMQRPSTDSMQNLSRQLYLENDGKNQDDAIMYTNT